MVGVIYKMEKHEVIGALIEVRDIILVTGSNI
jgi:hypothetical protein